MPPSPLGWYFQVSDIYGLFERPSIYISIPLRYKDLPEWSTNAMMSRGKQVEWSIGELISKYKSPNIGKVTDVTDPDIRV